MGNMWKFFREKGRISPPLKAPCIAHRGKAPAHIGWYRLAKVCPIYSGANTLCKISASGSIAFMASSNVLVCAPTSTRRLLGR